MIMLTFFFQWMCSFCCIQTLKYWNDANHYPDHNPDSSCYRNLRHNSHSSTHSRQEEAAQQCPPLEQWPVRLARSPPLAQPPARWWCWCSSNWWKSRPTSHLPPQWCSSAAPASSTPWFEGQQAYSCCGQRPSGRGRRPRSSGRAAAKPPSAAAGEPSGPYERPSSVASSRMSALEMVD